MLVEAIVHNEINYRENSILVSIFGEKIESELALWGSFSATPTINFSVHLKCFLNEIHFL